MQNKILILSVDRDDDIGSKTKHSGPIIGKKAVLEVASDLGIADPEDSDVNAMFEALRVYEEMKRGYDVEVAVLTGDKNVGIKSDIKIKQQIESVIKKFPASGFVLVTDGAEDEHILPILQSKLELLTIKRVIVKQAEQLESTYYKIKDFIHESVENPKIGRIVFGIPAVILLLLGIFGMEGIRVVIGILGLYLLIKGFKLDRYFTDVFDEIGVAFTRKRLTFFIYMLAVIIVVLSAYRGYSAMLPLWGVDIFQSVAAFLSESVYFFWLAVVIAWVGKVLRVGEKRAGRILAPPVFGFAIALLVFNAVDLILRPTIPIWNFLTAIVLGFIIMGAGVYLEARK